MVVKIDKFISDFLIQFEEEPKGNFNLESKFRDIDGWDSMTSMMIIAMIDEKYNIIISPENMKECNIIKDIFDLIAFPN